MKSVTQKLWNFLEEMRNLLLRLAFKPYFAEFISAIDFSKTMFWGSNFRDFGLKSQKSVPQQFMITKISTLKVSEQVICKFA